MRIIDFEMNDFQEVEICDSNNNTLKKDFIF